MINIRRANDRGHANHGWLDTNHTFSFADYYDPNFMGFRALRVINEDRVKAGVGFGKHAHRDMEIISYVLEGTLAHSDSMGTGSEIKPGDVQRMSAGSGVTHSEMNPSEDEAVHFLQIWIMPAERGIPPSYEQKHFAEDARRDNLRLVASPDGSDDSVTIHQDVRLYATLLDNTSVTHEFQPDRYGWIQVTRGAVDLNGQILKAGDGAAITDERSITLTGRGAEALLFDLN
ncbi:MAG TPA: pirin family protein [Thermoanaerobaculia bacterium]|jgi:redox-sensitive bicupin YhaK (pirin superfamily)|nr:pirin family protein [Thermoanaerobaculia bacterium]